MASGPTWWFRPGQPAELNELKLDEQRNPEPDTSPGDSGEDLAYLWLEDSQEPVSDELGACRLALVAPHESGGPPEADRWM